SCLDPFDQLWRAGPPRALPEPLADHLVPGVAAFLAKQAVRIENGAVTLHDPGKQRALLEERTELGTGRRSFGQQLALSLFRLAMTCHVARDLGRANDATHGIPDWRDSERHENATAVRPDALGFEVVDSLPRLQARDDVALLGDAVAGDDERDV